MSAGLETSSSPPSLNLTRFTHAGPFKEQARLAPGVSRRDAGVGHAVVDVDVFVVTMLRAVGKMMLLE